MAFSSTRVLEQSPVGGQGFAVYTATNVQTDGTSTITTDFRNIIYVGYQNKSRAAAGGLKTTVSAGVITLTSETADDDFELFIVGV